MGRPELKQAIVDGDTLYVPCEDNYESLLLKLVLGYEYLYGHFEFHYVFKIDDDCFLDIEKFKADIMPQIHSKKYFGFRIISKGRKLDTKWHFGKCTHPNFEKPFSLDKAPADYARGFGYLLHRAVLPTLISNKAILKKELEAHTYSYEDLRIGDILYHHQILPIQLKCKTMPASDYIDFGPCLVYDIENPHLMFKIERDLKDQEIQQKNQQIKQLLASNKILLDNRWCRFGKMSQKRKMWTIGKVISKKIKLYWLLQPIAKSFKQKSVSTKKS